jgi:hypothetical protein
VELIRVKIEATDFGFTFVICGAMNPSLHHPSWYNHIEVLSAEELKESLANDHAFVPQQAQFYTSSLKIICQQQRWQAETSDSKTVDRVREIASIIFDKRLAETPINAIGFNFNYIYETTQLNVGNYLATQLSGMPFKFPINEHSVGKISYSWPIGGNQLNVLVEPSPKGKQFVHIGFNLHIPIKESSTPERFDLGVMSNQIYQDAKPVIDEQIAAIINSMNKLKR